MCGGVRCDVQHGTVQLRQRNTNTRKDDDRRCTEELPEQYKNRKLSLSVSLCGVEITSVNSNGHYTIQYVSDGIVTVNQDPSQIRKMGTGQ